jgi:hypothetical protein
MCDAEQVLDNDWDHSKFALLQLKWEDSSRGTVDTKQDEPRVSTMSIVGLVSPHPHPLALLATPTLPNPALKGELLARETALPKTDVFDSPLAPSRFFSSLVLQTHSTRSPPGAHPLLAPQVVGTAVVVLWMAFWRKALLRCSANCCGELPG